MARACRLRARQKADGDALRCGACGMCRRTGSAPARGAASLTPRSRDDAGACLAQSGINRIFPLGPDASVHHQLMIDAVGIAADTEADDNDGALNRVAVRWHR